MTDPTQFMVEQSHLHKVLEHQGVLGIGRDYLTQKLCSLHLYTDPYNRTYVMQQYDQVDQQFVSNKLTNITKTSHSQFVSNITRVCFVSTRKTLKGLFELNIFYDATGVYGYSLQYVIKMKIKNEEKFEDEEILGFFWQIVDYIQQCGAQTGEYMEITPVNIFCKPQEYHGFNFFPNNFGLSFDDTKWQRRYFNEKDRFYKGQRTLQNCTSSAMFILGMVMLEMCTLEPPNKLFDQTSKQLDEKSLQKKIEGIKITRTPILCNIVKGLLKKEEQRITLKQIYGKGEFLKYRRAEYIANKAGLFGYKTFEGIVELSENNGIGEGLNEQLCLNRGRFVGGKMQGLCIEQRIQKDKNLINMGIFIAHKFIQGIQIHKNQAIYIGKVSKEKKKDLEFINQSQTGFISQGIMVLLNISTLTLQDKDKTMIAFQGDFDQFGQPIKGTKYYQNGKVQKI